MSKLKPTTTPTEAVATFEAEAMRRGYPSCPPDAMASGKAKPKPTRFRQQKQS